VLVSGLETQLVQKMVLLWVRELGAALEHQLAKGTVC
jgi:hypothetical protein